LRWLLVTLQDRGKKGYFNTLAYQSFDEKHQPSGMVTDFNMDGQPDLKVFDFDKDKRKAQIWITNKWYELQRIDGQQGIFDKNKFMSVELTESGWKLKDDKDLQQLKQGERFERLDRHDTSTNTNYEGHPIIGTWNFDMNGCTETYEFLPDGTRNCTSAEEIVQAAFIIASQPLDSGFYKMTDRVIKDNGKRDCSGSTKDMTGDVVDLYVKFNPRMDQIVFCFDQSFDKCFGPFRKNK